MLANNGEGGGKTVAAASWGGDAPSNTDILQYLKQMDNQRTSGPVNAHLRPEICTNKFS